MLGVNVVGREGGREEVHGLQVLSARAVLQDVLRARDRFVVQATLHPLLRERVPGDPFGPYNWVATVVAQLVVGGAHVMKRKRGAPHSRSQMTSD